MLKAVAGGQAGGGPPPRSVLSWSENPATGRLYQRGIVHQDDDKPSAALHSLLYLSPSLMPFDSPAFSFCCGGPPPSSSSPSCSEVLPPLCGCQARKAWRLDVKNGPKFDFLMNKQCNGTSPFWIIYVLLLVFFFLIQSSALSLYLLALLPPSLFASQAVWHPAPSL